MKRSGKFYRKNEAEVMKALGFKPTKNSGSGWIEKEDGQSEFAICQLKSTDASSIKVALCDLHTLEYNASVSHKTPVFAIQFLQTGDVYLLIKPEDANDIGKYLKTGEYDTKLDLGIDLNDEFEEMSTNNGRVIRSSSSARERFAAQEKKKFEKRGKSAK